MAGVLLCSHEPVLSEGLARLLSEADGLEFCAYCPRIEDLKAQLDMHQPEILLVDLTADVTFNVLSQLKDIARNSKMVLWVHSISTELALQAMTLGIRGIVRKTLPVEMLVSCLLRIDEGELWFEKTLLESVRTMPRYSLTRRESQLISLLSQGFKNKEIASTLRISEGTVKVYLSRLFQKLGVKDRLELALYGLRNLTPGSGSGDLPVPAPAERQRTFAAPQLPHSIYVEKLPIRLQTEDFVRVLK